MSRPQYCPGWIVYHICIAMAILLALSFFTCDYAFAETRWIAGPKLNNGYPYGAIGIETDSLQTFIARWTIDLGGKEFATSPTALLCVKRGAHNAVFLNLGPNLELIQPDMDNTRRIMLLSMAAGVEFRHTFGRDLNFHAGVIRIQPAQSIKPYKIYIFLSTAL